ncbi:MAG: hypothetical protein LBT38_02885 [Deltaproteobacteria bacterium]|jgi:3-deoxy-D-manno-octulosonic-acid transferase|nr:hypothetical protein [Deltaproteobacteria bacterium]
MRAFYTILYALGFLLVAPYWLTRGLFNRLYFQTLKRRFIGPGKILPRLGVKSRVWVWAMSLGEVLSARELVRELEKDGHEVIISATTLAGLAMAKTNWPNNVVLPSPLDFSLSIKRFLEHTQPDQLILVETDIWPGVLLELKKRSLKASLVSARLSPRSFKNYRRIKFFWSKVLGLFHLIVAQTPEDRVKFLALGAPESSVVVGGNLKFDLTEPGPQEKAQAELLRETGWPQARYLVAGSFHPGEDVMILEIFQALRKDFPDLRLILAPRDRHKFCQVYRLAEEIFPQQTARRSKPQPTDPQSLVFILDTLGELENFYALAEVALIGKSWPGPHEGGGHNPLEASIRRRAVLAGPRNHNFKWIYQALSQAGGAIIVDKLELAPLLKSLLGDLERLQRLGLAGQQFVAKHRGAVRATLDLLESPKAPS